MDRRVQLSVFLAVCLHGVLLFGITPQARRDSVRAETEKPHVSVDLVEARKVEEPPPAPQPEPSVAPPAVEQPKEVPPPEPEPQPLPVVVPEPVKSIPVQETVTAPVDAEFKVAATTNQVGSTVQAVVPVAPQIVEGPGDVVVKAEARYRKNPEPPYPVQAKRRRQEGLVILTVILDQRGIPTKVEVKQSSGFSLLDTAAVEAIRSWEFEPARVNDRTLPSEVEVPVRFRLSK